MNRWYVERLETLTMTVESRAAIATISAHETTPGQAFSTLDLISSITLNPLTDPTLGLAVFSPVKEEVSSRSMDPSQPCIMNPIKHRLSSLNGQNFSTLKYNYYEVLGQQAKKRKQIHGVLYVRSQNLQFIPCVYYKNIMIGYGTEGYDRLWC